MYILWCRCPLSYIPSSLEQNEVEKEKSRSELIKVSLYTRENSPGQATRVFIRQIETRKGENTRERTIPFPMVWNFRMERPALKPTRPELADRTVFRTDIFNWIALLDPLNLKIDTTIKSSSVTQFGTNQFLKEIENIPFEECSENRFVRIIQTLD